MSGLKIIFMGTPAFAVPTLEKLMDAGYEIAAVVTAPDRLGGRGKNQLLESDVKKFAAAQGLLILQPEKLRNPEFVETLQNLKPDLMIVVAFRMLPEMVWSIPRLGTFNLHGSLLPKYRGAAPINWAIIKGEKETGVTTFLLDKAIDTGQILLQQSIRIEETDNAGSLHDKMMLIGADLVLATVQQLESGNVRALAQKEEESSHAPKIFKETCQIDFTKSGKELYNFIRGLSPFPGAWTLMGDKELKILETLFHPKQTNMNPGEWTVRNQKLEFGTVDGVLEVLSLQPEGKKRMSVREFLNGYREGK
jgi:methionyl-tRNA formyltransferase